MSAPLDGLTVIDLTHVLAGPYASMLLAEMGARVIKVERPGSGDDVRAFPPFRDDASAYFEALNRGKASIALDLHAEADREVFEALLARADLLLENFRPGVMERLGYGWETLHERFPRLIYGAVSGFGRTGPDRLRPAYDMVVQARGGIMSVTGTPGEEPVRCGASIGDIVAGLFLGQGVLAALYDRERTGKGRFIDVAMLDSQLAILPNAVAIAGVTGTPPGPSGARHPSITPFETFHAADGLFVIAVGNDALFARLAEALGHAEWAEDPRFATNRDRCTHADLLKEMIEAETRAAPRARWIALLEEAGVPTGPIHDVAEVMADPQIRARNMVVTVEDEGGHAPLPVAGNPIKISGLDDPATRPPAPLLDGDRQAILDWLAGGSAPGEKDVQG